MSTPITDPSMWVYSSDGKDVKDIDRHQAERITNGFSTYDYWNACDYLAWVNVQMLTKFRNEGHGHPMDLTPEEWDDILDQMIAGFEAHLELSRGDFNEELQDTMNNGLQLYAKWFGSLWD